MVLQKKVGRHGVVKYDRKHRRWDVIYDGAHVSSFRDDDYSDAYARAVADALSYERSARFQ